MKVTTYKVPVKLTRSANGVTASLIEEEKVFLKTEDVNVEPTFIPNKAKELADANSKQLELVKITILGKETEITSHVELKYLED